MKSDKLKIAVLILVNFLSGAAVMVVEMTGIRLIAPLYGTTIYAWTSLIGVVLISISFGGYFGGRVSDQNKTTKPLQIVLFLSALSTLIIPITNLFVQSIGSSFGIVSGPIIVSTILFVIPAFLLGMISPIITRSISRLDGDKKIGQAAGLANMSGALGSFLGTFAAGFLLIPYLDHRLIFLCTAAVLTALILLTRNTFEIKGAKITAPVLFIVAALPIAWLSTSPETEPNLLFSEESIYQKVRVYQTTPSSDTGLGPFNSLFNGRQLQGSMFIDSGAPLSIYPMYWNLAKLYNPAIENALVLGGGAYSVPRMIALDIPDIPIDVVEIDPVVVHAANEYFNIGELNSVTTHLDDARHYLSVTDNQYDFAMLDIFNGVISIPSHLVTVDFFEELDGSLSDSGVVMMNLIGSSIPEHNSVGYAIHKTLSEVFSTVHVYTPDALSSYDSSFANIIIFATNAEVDDVTLKTNLPPHLAELLSTYDGDFNDVDYLEGLVLTDRVNPIDRLNHSLMLHAIQ